MLSDTLAERLSAYRIGPKIRGLRLGKRMGLAQLGDHTGLSAGMLSRIERGQSVPTLPTLLRIALVFGVGLDHFFSDGSDGPLLQVLRADERIRLPNAAGGAASFHFESLDFDVSGRSSEAFLAIFHEDGPTTAAHSHAGYEFLHVIEGWVELSIHGDRHRLEAGDTITFDADFDHDYRGAGRALVVTRPAL